MYAVVDTSVLISGLRSRVGASHAVLLAIRYGAIKTAISVSLVMEYEAVALRPECVPYLTEYDIRSVINLLCRVAHHQKIFFTWRPFLPDAYDDHVLELAVAANCDCIITHNVRDFKGSESMGIQIITPAQAIERI